MSSQFSQRLLNLITEPYFVRYENLLREPNFFTIVGRSHYERWHTAFWGWLLDVNGSHLLGEYTLRRLLALLVDDSCHKSSLHSEGFLLHTIPLASLDDVQVWPNEFVPVETSVRNVGRFDVFLSFSYGTVSSSWGRANMLLELKIDSRPDAEQSRRYADWLLDQHPADANLLIYLTPQLARDSRSTVGDERWYCLNYQLLNDKLLLPLLDHPRLNDKVRPFIVQYVKNLRTRNRGIKMAITDEEKRLALALYDKYSDVFDSIYDALVSAGVIDASTADVSSPKGRASGRLSVRIDDQVIQGENVRSLFDHVLHFLVQNGYVLRLPMPWGISSQRYIITNEEPPLHPNGRPFFYPVKHQGYTLESHYARDRALRVLTDLCSKLELRFEAIEP